MRKIEWAEIPGSYIVFLRLPLAIGEGTYDF
jgi:hypothetical protein